MLDSGDSKNGYLEFEKHFVNTLNKHVPKKAKILREHYKPHINKTLCKAISKNSQLNNKANKTRDLKNVINYNSVVKLKKYYKKEHFDNLNPFRDPKPFWKTCKTYICNKHSFGESKIALTENGETMTKISIS